MDCEQHCTHLVELKHTCTVSVCCKCDRRITEWRQDSRVPAGHGPYFPNRTAATDTDTPGATGRSEVPATVTWFADERQRLLAALGTAEKELEAALQYIGRQKFYGMPDHTLKFHSESKMTNEFWRSVLKAELRRRASKL